MQTTTRLAQVGYNKVEMIQKRRRLKSFHFEILFLKFLGDFVLNLHPSSSL